MLEKAKEFWGMPGKWYNVVSKVSKENYGFSHRGSPGDEGHCALASSPFFLLMPTR